MNIYGLKDCFGGHSNRECSCVQKDDMDKIYPTVQSCGGIVLVSPLYYRNLSVQLRTAMDFLFAPEENDGNPLRDHKRLTNWKAI